MNTRADVTVTPDAGRQDTRLTRRVALGLPIAGIACVARAAPPFIEPAVKRLAEPLEDSLGKGEKKQAGPFPGGHLEGDPLTRREQIKEHDVHTDQAKLEKARSRLSRDHVNEQLQTAKKWVRLVTNAAQASRDVVAIFGGEGDRATLDDLLNAVQKMGPELATLTGIRQRVIDQALDFAKPINDGSLDLAWFEQAFAYARTAVVLSDARLHTDSPAFDDEATYASALVARFGVFALTAPPNVAGTANPRLSYDASSRTLSVTIDGRTWKIDVKQLAEDIAKQLYQRLTKRMVARLATAAIVELVPGAGPFVGICVLCGEFLA